MNAPVTLPLWLLVLILLFAAVTFASHFLFPSVRWFFRKRMERAVARLNERLARPIEPFKLARRFDTIQRLIYDPDVAKAIHKAATAEGIPDNVAFERAKRYAREIVPSFSASVYFGFGARLAKLVSRSMYKIRLGAMDQNEFGAIDRDATLVFVINHRSNMDYMLVTHLISSSSTIAYAVGEWARVWPLSWLVRAMGAYFIRRGSRGQLYRAVLSRYVRMATENGVTQAFFPEGGLSLTGAIAKPKMGLLSYIVDASKPDGRDVIFVPVALNYDRVPEDRLLIRAAITGERKFRPSLWSALLALPATLWRAVRLKFTPFGTASVGFGSPIVLSEFLATSPDRSIDELADVLMENIAKVVPLVPVPLVARAMLQGHFSKDSITEAIGFDLASLRSRGVTLPRRSAAELATEGLALMLARKMIRKTGDTYEIVPDERSLLDYYAASIAHHFCADAA
ncbi:1-acyl-sn-glycerol-3-phosphate acyltransferase [Marivivens donghaensis]|uniref:1-acyl-sn-glycerol-3-phosphate acyltransferase n=1 Tax=Marivivens donghaensis TaxID=1699413 RepID=UPI00201F9887|nr:1-acyl-sn-glycerol-3-phosphate acyltransferase [Marivivens donghaensis]MCL7408689.1 1-acyl-sn-glycerol-3-phosphate acyltransferase [Marivivens donghaensis]MDN3703268.1 1-acyl-sn-glycerol-3-phosphate acyltransferase [Marivivens donghaensis]